MTLLQVQSFGVFETLTQYGALGVITLGLGYVVWALLKRQIASEDRLKSKVEDLQKEMNDYIKTDLQKVTTALENNTKAMIDLRDIIIRKNS
jgi:3-mercaptopyruvate sulfurtransferase SseA